MAEKLWFLQVLFYGLMFEQKTKKFIRKFFLKIKRNLTKFRAIFIR